MFSPFVAHRTEHIPPSEIQRPSPGSKKAQQRQKSKGMPVAPETDWTTAKDGFDIEERLNLKYNSSKADPGLGCI